MLISTSKGFTKTVKLHEPVRLVECVIFEQFICASLHQIAFEIMLLFINYLHEKS